MDVNAACHVVVKLEIVPKAQARGRLAEEMSAGNGPDVIGPYGTVDFAVDQMDGRQLALPYAGLPGSSFAIARASKHPETAYQVMLLILSSPDVRRAFSAGVT